MNKKLISLVLASMAVAALAGCNKSTPAPAPAELPDEYSLLEHWAGNPEEEYYEVSKSGDNTVISYAGVTGWKYVARSFAYDSKDVARFTAYKKLTFSGTLSTTAGTPYVLLKFESTQVNKERVFEFKSTSDTYEIDLSFITAEKWTSDLKILFFANMPSLFNGDNQNPGSGTMTFTKIALSKAEVNPEKNIDVDPVPPQSYNEYNGGDSLAVMTDWRSNDGTYTVEQEGQTWKATWDATKSDWDSMKALVKDGTASLKTSGLKRLYVKVNGTEGVKLIVKVEAVGAAGAAEVTTALTGADQEVEVNVENVIKTEGATSFMVLFFINYEAPKAETGTLVLKEAKLDKTEVIPPVPAQEENIYESGDTFSIDKDWRSNGGTITCTPANGGWKFTYGSTKNAWDAVVALVKNNAALLAAGFKKIVFEVTGTAGIPAYLKFEAPGSEQLITFTGEKQTIEVGIATTLANVDAAQFKAVIIPDANNEQLKDVEIVLSKCELSKEELAPVVNPQAYNEYNGGDSMTVMTDWRSPYGGIEIAPSNDTEYKITWGTKGEWEGPRALVKAGTTALKDSGINKARFTLSGTAGRKVLCKLEAHNTGSDAGFAGTESGILDLTGEEQVIEFDATGTINATYDEIWVIVMPDAGNQGTADPKGEIILKNVVLSKGSITPPTPTQNYNLYNGGDSLTVMTDWQSSELGVEAVTGGYTITWGAKGAWSNAKALVKDGTSKVNEAGFKRAVYEIEGTEGRNCLFKLELHGGTGNGKNVEHYEKLTGAKQTVEFDVTELLANEYEEVWVLFFPDAGKEGQVDAGTATLTNCYLDKTEVTPVVEKKNTLNWPGIYFDQRNYTGPMFEVENDKHITTIGMSAAAPAWGNNVQWKVDEQSESWFDVKEYTHIYFKIKSTVAVKSLMKLFDSEVLEIPLDLEADVEQVIEYDITRTDLIISANPIVFFPHRGSSDLGAVTGTITITDFQMVRPRVNTGSNGEARLANVLTDNYDGMTFGKDANGNLAINMDKEALGYDSFQVIANVDGEGYNHITGTIKSDADVHMIFKNDNGGEEIRVLVNAGVDYALDITFKNGLDVKWGKIIMMVGTGEQGTTAKSAIISFENLKISK